MDRMAILAKTARGKIRKWGGGGVVATPPPLLRERVNSDVSNLMFVQQLCATVRCEGDVSIGVSLEQSLTAVGRQTYRASVLFNILFAYRAPFLQNSSRHAQIGTF